MLQQASGALEVGAAVIIEGNPGNESFGRVLAIKPRSAIRAADLEDSVLGVKDLQFFGVTRLAKIEYVYGSETKEFTALETDGRWYDLTGQLIVLTVK
jgi:hypothetical protein